MASKKGLALLIGAPSDKEGDVEGGSDAKQEAAKAVLEAVKAEDAEALAMALEDAYAACSGEYEDEDDEEEM